ncbi:MAG TPA: formate dehydrogenase accessory sulfurtransferase FdhD [Candidatus Saccharimonadales bacterium]|nr:formate dehydrogenase accessory sulfurtransferase FdhD [Candidatus Saccharimonadales bacterium]
MSTEVRQTARPGPPRLYRDGTLTPLERMPPPERAITLIVDGEELATIACSPVRVIALALGFLRVEDIIQTVADVALMEVCDDETVVKVRLAPTARKVPHDRKRILTSGCGRGVTFSLDVVPVQGGLTVRPEQVMSWMETLLDTAAGYKEHGGTHAAGLFGSEGLEVLVEDIGRHNTIDRIAGESLLADRETAGKAILTSGRISSEMLVKASRLGIGVVASRTSPTELAVSLAQEAGIALLGYVRRGQLQLFHDAGRVTL